MATFTVTTATDAVDAGDGQLSLREAVAQANGAAGADTILFAAGLEGSTLTLTQGQLALSGETVVDGDRDSDGARVTLSGGDASRVLDVAAGERLTLRDLAITDGRVEGADGGGVRVGDSGSLTMANCTVASCAAGKAFESYGSGGGLFLGEGARLDATGSTLAGNTAYGSGGNIAGAGGSGIYMTRSTVRGGYAQNGGGVSAAGRIEAVASTFEGNRVYTYNNDIGGGGGLDVTGSAYVARSLFTGNSAPGGGAIRSSGQITVSDTTIAGNTSFGDETPGGTAGISGTDITLRSATITGNYSGGEGAFYGQGAGLASSSARVYDSVIVGNSSAGGPSDVAGQLAFSNGRNLFGSTTAGAVPGDLANVDAALVFAALDARGGGLLAQNGGPTRTVALRDAPDNPALSAGSPATGGDTDQRGTARPQPDGTSPDLGAFELIQSSVPTTASARNDVLTGTAAADTISGLAGADLVRGQGGGDRLFGNDGSDTLFGAAGDDRLEGGLGSDWIDGGDGTDRVSYFNEDFPPGVSVNLVLETASRGGELDFLFNVEDVDGGNGTDTIVGNFEANRLGGAGGVDRLFGEGGDDVLNGGLGNDRLDGDSGRDLADFSAGGAVTVDLSLAADRATRAGGEVDTLLEVEGALGSRNADTFRGDAGANLFRGNAGKDRQTGDAGADDFDYDALADSPVGANRDVIADFAPGSDDIDLSTIDARAGTPGNQAFAFLAAEGADFTAAGQVRFDRTGGLTLVEASTDADAAAELQVELTGPKTLAAADFVL